VEVRSKCSKLMLELLQVVIFKEALEGATTPQAKLGEPLLWTLITHTEKQMAPRMGYRLESNSKRWSQTK